jgi:hypothetical protein
LEVINNKLLIKEAFNNHKYTAKITKSVNQTHQILT